ncbi:MAG: IclR family transcriptional regulator [Acidimicrobiales bacterium]
MGRTAPDPARLDRTSPPTARVVAVLDLLATGDGVLSASEIARRLNLSTSTCASVLDALDQAGYVERLADKSYQLGAGLLRLAAGLQPRFPLLGAAHEELRRLHEELRVGCTFTQISSGHMRLLVAVSDPNQFPEGIRPGDTYPLAPPYGWLWAAWRSPAEIERWMARSPTPLDDVERAHYRRVMAGIRERGYSVASLDATGASVLEDLRAVLGALATDPHSSSLRGQLTRLFGLFGRHPYSRAELNVRHKLPVSYLLAPVFDAGGEPVYEIELAMVRPSMTTEEIAECGERLVRATANLTQLIGGRAPARNAAPIPKSRGRRA